MMLFININMTCLIFTKFKCVFVILIVYVLYIGDRFFKYLFLGLFIIANFFVLLLIIYDMIFTFANVFYLNNVLFRADNLKSITDIYSLRIMAKDFSNYGKEVLISVYVTSENTK